MPNLTTNHFRFAPQTMGDRILLELACNGAVRVALAQVAPDELRRMDHTLDKREHELREGDSVALLGVIGPRYVATFRGAPPDRVRLFIELPKSKAGSYDAKQTPDGRWMAFYHDTHVVNVVHYFPAAACQVCGDVSHGRCEANATVGL